MFEEKKGESVSKKTKDKFIYRKGDIEWFHADGAKIEPSESRGKTEKNLGKNAENNEGLDP